MKPKRPDFIHSATTELAVRACKSCPTVVYLYGPSGAGTTRIAQQFGLPGAKIITDTELEALTPEQVDAWADEGRQVIVTSSFAPASARLNDRLKSRLCRGVVLHVMLPDHETRARFLRENWTDIPDVILNAIAPIPLDFRTLLGIITTGKTVMEQSGSVDRVRATLADFTRRPIFDRGVLIDDVIEVVSRRFMIPRERLTSKRRQATLSRARHIVFYLARELTNLTLGEIGTLTGGFDHSSVIHGFNRVNERLYAKEPGLNEAIAVCRADLTERLSGS